MTSIRRSADCGNSPKNQFAEEYVIALLTGDMRTLEPASADGINIEQGHGETPSTIQIDHVVTHGKVGAVSGTVGFDNGRSSGFCFMLTFETAKANRVSKVTRYSL